MRKVSIILGVLGSLVALFFAARMFYVTTLLEGSGSETRRIIVYPWGLNGGDMKVAGIILLISAALGIVGTSLRSNDRGKLAGLLMIAAGLLSGGFALVAFGPREPEVWTESSLFVVGGILSFLATSNRAHSFSELLAEQSTKDREQ